MKCPNCGSRMVESNMNKDTEDMFIKEYFCFECHNLFECSSQSGDFVEEYLDHISLDRKE